MRAETFGASWLDMDLPFPCELHWMTPKESRVPGARRVLVIFTEPLANMVSSDWVLANHAAFDLIIAYDRRLAGLPNVVLAEFGSSWCDRLPASKDFSVSFLLSTGGPHIETRFAGHEIRREVAACAARHAAPLRLFFSSKGIGMRPAQMEAIRENVRRHGHATEALGDSKMPLFTSMFHICIENAADDHFFTEKVIDCFRTYTVPIYWGTRTIGDYFDRDGMLFFERSADINDVLASLSVEEYWKRAAAMRANYLAAEKFADPPPKRIEAILRARFPNG